MKVFLIVVAVLVVIFAIILSLSAELTVIYNGDWQTTVQVLFWKKDLDLAKILNFVLFPDKAGKQAAEKEKKKTKDDDSKEKTKENTTNVNEERISSTNTDTSEIISDDKIDEPSNEEKKTNFITKIIDEDGIVGIMELASNLIQTLNTALVTLFRGLHINSLYVKIIVGGGDAADIGMNFGDICKFYYPLKGVILNGMKVDQYDDYVVADYIAPSSEYGLQLIASMNIALILRIALKSGFVFLINFIKNK